MKNLLIAALLLPFLALAQAPVQRNPWSTNVTGNVVLGNDNLSITNIGHGTNWTFYGIGPSTVARLGDLMASSNNWQVVDLVADLSTIDGTSSITNALVTDPARGGIFIWYAAGYTNDDGRTFTGTSGYWVRQYEGVANMKWWGATGDGTTDDSAAVQAALNTGISLFAPAGCYAVTNVAPTRRGQIISGESIDYSSGAANTGTQFKCRAADQAVFVINVPQVTLRDMYIYGNANGGVGIDIQDNDGSQALIDNVNIWMGVPPVSYGGNPGIGVRVAQFSAVLKNVNIQGAKIGVYLKDSFQNFSMQGGAMGDISQYGVFVPESSASTLSANFLGTEITGTEKSRATNIAVEAYNTILSFNQCYMECWGCTNAGNESFGTLLAIGKAGSLNYPSYVKFDSCRFTGGSSNTTYHTIPFSSNFVATAASGNIVSLDNCLVYGFCVTNMFVNNVADDYLTMKGVYLYSAGAYPDSFIGRTNHYRRTYFFGGVNVDTATGSKVAIFDANKFLTNSTVDASTLSGAMHTNGAAFAQYQVPKAADATGLIYMPSALFGDSTGTNMNVIGTFSADGVAITNALVVGTPAGSNFAKAYINGGTKTTNFPALEVRETFNNAAVDFKGMRVVVTNTASGTGTRPFEVYGGSGGSTLLMDVNNSGALTTGNSITSGLKISLAAGSEFFWNTRSCMFSPEDGGWRLTDQATTKDRIRVYGTEKTITMGASNSVVLIGLNGTNQYVGGKIAYTIRDTHSVAGATNGVQVGSGELQYTAATINIGGITNQIVTLTDFTNAAVNVGDLLLGWTWAAATNYIGTPTGFYLYLTPTNSVTTRGTETARVIYTVYQNGPQLITPQ